MLRSVIPNLFYAVAHLSLSEERRGPLSQNNRKIYSQSTFTYKCEQTKYGLYDNKTSNFIQF